MRRRILVTNDDGIASAGIRALAAAVADLGHDVLVVAPLDDRSGVGSALYGAAEFAAGTVPVQQVDGLPGVPFTGIGGTPALAVTMARLGLFGPPPWCVVSGINLGVNTGRSVLHSGTVCAALTGATLGMSGLAVSIDARQPRHLNTAAAVAAMATEWLVAARKRTVLNVNVPDLPPDALRGVRWGRLAAFGRARRTAATAPDGQLALAVDVSPLPLDPATDEGLVDAGYVCVTPLAGVQAIEDPAAARHLDEHLTRLAAR